MKQAGILKVILVVEHDIIQREAISQQLRKEGYFVLATADGPLAASFARENPLSLIILNADYLLLPDKDWYRHVSLCSQADHIPLFVIARDANEATAVWHSGVILDDCITQPFLWEELRACVIALLHSGKRSRPRQIAKGSPQVPPQKKEEQVLLADDLCIDVARHEVIRRGQPIQIGSALLFQLLVYLVRHRGTVLSKDQLLTQVWGYAAVDEEEHTRTVAVHVHWLRELLEDNPRQPRLIQTVRGVGYRFAG